MSYIYTIFDIQLKDAETEKMFLEKITEQKITNLTAQLKATKESQTTGTCAPTDKNRCECGHITCV